jgi:hypothetical protein
MAAAQEPPSGWLEPRDAGALVGRSDQTIHLWIEKGWIGDQYVWETGQQRPKCLIDPCAVLAAAILHVSDLAADHLAHAEASHSQRASVGSPPSTTTVESESSPGANATDRIVAAIERAHGAELELSQERGAHVHAQTLLDQTRLELARERTKVRGLVSIIGMAEDDISALLDLLPGSTETSKSAAETAAGR